MDWNQHGIVAAVSAAAGSILTGIGAIFHFGRRIGALETQVLGHIKVDEEIHEQVVALRTEINETIAKQREEWREDIRELRLLIAGKKGD